MDDVKIRDLITDVLEKGSIELKVSREEVDGLRAMIEEVGERLERPLHLRVFDSSNKADAIVHAWLCQPVEWSRDSLG